MSKIIKTSSTIKIIFSITCINIIVSLVISLITIEILIKGGLFPPNIYLLVFLTSTPPALLITPFISYKTIDIYNRIIKNEQSALKLASIDELTQLYNRRYFANHVKKELSKCDSNMLCTFILLDIDLFKAINDTYGHPVGDKVLKAIGNIIKTSLNEHAICGRYGGEEFIIFLFNTCELDIEKIAENLRINIDSFIIENLEEIKFTASIGVATGQANVDNYENLIKLSDDCMYKAKHKGRNRVEFTSIIEPIN